MEGASVRVVRTSPYEIDGRPVELGTLAVIGADHQAVRRVSRIQRSWGVDFLYEADLQHANLSDADLRSALLHRVRNVEIDQLAAVRTLYLTELAELMELVETTCPKLLQAPG